jgi:hypothetical protein
MARVEKQKHRESETERIRWFVDTSVNGDCGLLTQH